MLPEEIAEKMKHDAALLALSDGATQRDNDRIAQVRENLISYITGQPARQILKKENSDEK